jgi:lipoyl(octanoyl) transferase
MNTKIVVHHLGIINYVKGIAVQESFFNDNIHKKLNKDYISTTHHLLLCEHYPVITLGKSGKIEHLLQRKQYLQASGIEFYSVNRGGDITAHNQGQLVVYPILDLEIFFTDLKKYVHLLEESVILTLSSYNIVGERSVGETGVWIDVGKSSQRKIAAIGVKTSRWVTMHGLALNVNNDLAIFEYIIPCGISKAVTSMKNELGYSPNFQEVEHTFVSHFLSLFGN